MYIYFIENRHNYGLNITLLMERLFIVRQEIDRDR